MNIQMITAPFIGGLIGLITNSIAIRMLFHPYKKIMIGGIHVPFTPGLIPKEQSRIAHAVAHVIANDILDSNTILHALASETIHEMYEKQYDKKIDAFKSMDINCGELLENYHLDQSFQEAKESIGDSVSDYLINQCQQEQVVRKIMDEAFHNIKEKMNPVMYKMGKSALHIVKEFMIEQLENLINTEGKVFIKNYIDSVYDEWMDKPVNEMILLIEQKVPNLKDMLWEKYLEFIENKFIQFLSILNLEEIIENKIKSFEVEELEKIILEISKKELNALVWFGGLLGMLMGFINLLF